MSRLQVTLSDLTSNCVFQSLRASQRQIKNPNPLKLAMCNTDMGIYQIRGVSSFGVPWLGSLRQVGLPKTNGWIHHWTCPSVDKSPRTSPPELLIFQYIFSSTVLKFFHSSMFSKLRGRNPRRNLSLGVGGSRCLNSKDVATKFCLGGRIHRHKAPKPTYPQNLIYPRLWKNFIFIIMCQEKGTEISYFLGRDVPL